MATPIKGQISIEDEILYSDINIGMTQSSRDEIAYQERAVRNGIHYLLLTPRRQRLMRPSFGTYLIGLLFLPVIQSTADSIKHAVFTAIDTWEDKAKILRNGVTVIPLNNRDGYQVNLRYYLVELNNLQATYEFKIRSLR